MTTETNRSDRIAFVGGFAVVAFAVGLLTSRSFFKRDVGVSTDLQIAAEYTPE